MAVNLAVGGAMALAIAGCATLAIRPPPDIDPIEKVVVATAYCPCGSCCNWRRNIFFRPVIASGPNEGKPKKVGVTASGNYARHGTIAADTSVYPMGTIMYIDGYGYGRVEDRGSAIKGDRIDLYFRTHREAAAWGSKKLRVKVWPAYPSES
jgi:3D (Asp-Asp-Asp) domain-containing protein